MRTDLLDIRNMDCMDLMRDLPDNHFDLAIVDPPYGIGYDIQQNAMAVSGRKSNGGMWKHYKKSDWDSQPPPPPYFEELRRVARTFIVWGGNYFQMKESGVIVWNKGENGSLPHGELAVSNAKTFKVFNMSRTDAYINNDSQKIHPTQKPVALYKWLLQNYAKPGQKILDTHMGSGSIAIACHYFGAHLTAAELDADYFKAACERIEKETAQEDMFTGGDFTQNAKQEEMTL
jgi:site-specific DNA-methyltransferase (adenine-specific)